ncbi:hypothetical protein C8D77_11176 [Mesorhizobium loti]|uniref:Uncharacterized protein n=1 Tax=Rhizobium loti TaxID=381 RepID=A0A8E2W891_RHILI|nr:hypothetical protein [Mesorhizobium loti]PWJ88354.1 hypothetical protein C8D77_11176 [Mesorhizobium loti]
MAKVTASDIKQARITIELLGEEHILIPSPEAMLDLSMAYDGFAPLMAAIARLNAKAMADTVVAGLRLKGQEARDMASIVVRSGVLELMPKLQDFAAILANGGRPLKTESTEEEGGEKRPL